MNIIYNNKAFVQRYTTHLFLKYSIYILGTLVILLRYERSLVETSIRLQACIPTCLSETNKDWDET
jgi:hypothetical protein